MTIQGLENNGYFINNPIIVSVSSSDIYRLEVGILNLTNGQNVTLPNLYPNPSNQIISFSIEDIIKGLFTTPNHNENYTAPNPIILNENSNKFLLTFNLILLDGTIETNTIEKVFIRGGRYTDQKNQSFPANTSIAPTSVTPIFSGFPSALYSINNAFKIVKYNSGAMFQPSVKIEFVRRKSFNGKYVAFLNSLGGYSYWLFDNFEDESSTTNIGVINNGFNESNLGNNYESSFKVLGKIPERFYPLMRDLISSPDIWLWQPEIQKWKRIYSDGNKWISNGAKVAYKVDYKFSDFTNYNPALL